MRISTKLNRFVVVACYLIIFNTCAKDKLAFPGDFSDCDTLIYSREIKTIIDNSCAYIGCHDGVSEAPGNYEDYDGLMDHLDNGSFRDRVFYKLDMPPKPSFLQKSTIDSLRCWLETGFQK